ncbi:hypothetical protein [Sorangium sp. So ce381]|uniref:hypothetical protein n=1 Tax=Sorangium sp. So ce381 TaxID=3133307 RepID=UPI003F5B1EF9
MTFQTLGGSETDQKKMCGIFSRGRGRGRSRLAVDDHDHDHDHDYDYDYDYDHVNVRRWENAARSFVNA